jgi:hypothetical protein
VRNPRTDRSSFHSSGKLPLGYGNSAELIANGIGPPGPKAGRRPPLSRTSAINASGSSSYGFAPKAVHHFPCDTRIRVQGPRCVSSGGSVVPISSFANHGLLWVSYPAFSRYYEDTKTAFVRLSAFAFRSASIPRWLSVSWRPPTESEPAVQDLGKPVRSNPADGVETGGSPSFPGNPVRRSALL